MRPEDREFLRQAATHAGFPESEADRFCEQIERRLEKGAEEYGPHAYLERTFPELEAEAIEEQADAGGWSSLALRRLDDAVERGFPSDIAELVRLHVYEGVSLAHQSARALEAAVSLYSEHAHTVSAAASPPAPPRRACGPTSS